MDTQVWDALVASMKNAYTAGLGEGAVPRPVIMPLVRGELVGLIWVRPLKAGEDALTGIAALSNIAAAAGADEIVLAWETHDVATACRLPLVGPAPCLNMVHATKDGHVLHQLPYTEQSLAQAPEDPAAAGPRWLPALEPQPGGELPPPIQAAVNYSFTPLELDHPSPFGVTVVLMEEDGYSVRLTETFAR
ncbi:hypothetical protein [Streptomyces yerevanensis]|uniref:hypothetical protein n=1 Tax=Streptomyces yerevanensis TaxID=66378 RepID=UPI000523F8C9|nr:hypothetical protein [Streptomyces yerevanensis]